MSDSLHAHIIRIVDAKRQGVDCTEDESAMIKRYFDRFYPDGGPIAAEVADLFPLETAEWWEDVEAGRR